LYLQIHILNCWAASLWHDNTKIEFCLVFHGILNATSMNMRLIHTSKTTWSQYSMNNLTAWTYFTYYLFKLLLDLYELDGALQPDYLFLLHLCFFTILWAIIFSTYLSGVYFCFYWGTYWVETGAISLGWILSLDENQILLSPILQLGSCCVLLNSIRSDISLDENNCMRFRGVRNIWYHGQRKCPYFRDVCGLAIGVVKVLALFWRKNDIILNEIWLVENKKKSYNNSNF